MYTNMYKYVHDFNIIIINHQLMSKLNVNNINFCDITNNKPVMQ